MAATVRATSQFVAAGSVTSGTVPLPTGWQSGDVLYIFSVLASATGTITAPSGYTELIAQFHNSGTTSATMELCRKVLTSSESAPVVTCKSGRLCCIGVAVQGADNTTPEDVSAASDTNSGVTWPSVRAPSVSPVASNALLLTGHGEYNGTGSIAMSFTPPSGMTEVNDQACNTASSNVALEVASLALSASGATGTKTATNSASTHSTVGPMGVTVAVRAAGGATVSGDVAVAETVTITATGTSTVLGAAAVAETVTITAAGTSTVLGAAAVAETVTITAAGTTTALAAAAVAPAVTITASATVGAGPISADVALSETVTITAAGTTTALAAASVAETVTITAAGTGTRLAAAAVAETVTITAAGTGTRLAAAAVAETVTITAGGTSTVLGAAAVSSAVTITATATVGSAPISADVAVAETVTITAAGTGTRLAAAAVAPAVTITAAATGTRLAAAAVAPAVTITAAATGTVLGAAAVTPAVTITAAAVIPAAVTNATSAPTVTDPRDGTASVSGAVHGASVAAQVTSSPMVADPRDGSRSVTAAATSTPSVSDG